ncbi:MAG: tryptophan 2,3-dioxygenase family protein [Actinomycetota bacterium]
MSAITPPQFGEEGRRLSYSSYLHIGELRSLQHPLADPPAHDEHLFIIVHQVYELWFCQIMHDLRAIRDDVRSGAIAHARHLFTRAHSIERVLVQQVDVLETMAPPDFLAFRKNLAPASGFQSAQFREIEIISGTRDQGILDRLDATPEEAVRLQALMHEPSIWNVFCDLLETRGLPMPAGDAAGRRESLLRMTKERDRYESEHALSEAMIQHDELFALWRQRHVLMVERQIGTKSGTGGSAGSPYLRSTLEKRFYPELWELRSYL